MTGPYAAPPKLSASFPVGPNGPLFVLEIASISAAPRATVLLMPPFAEEMNRSRYMLAQTGRALARQGFRVLLADPSGTGDSAGDFEQASWDRWIADLSFLRDMARLDTEPLWIGGVRTGALLAATLAHQEPDGIDGLLMIQPVLSGKRFLTQFLRLRVAAAMNRGQRESTAQLMEILKNGESVSVTGYPLGPDMAEQLTRLSLKDMPPPPDLPIEWIEIGSDERETDAIVDILPPSWRTADRQARYHQDQAFWALPEPVAPPKIIALIQTALMSHHP
ncbi:hydrolase 2, exosortase A system-associated [Iodidimonas gelatinilytica]|uniref:Hydrolase 2, exosortase A system-associated n=1 Tax=Iodidimonas gelatinilytica TaxID=1236966 RepID=A0A5A7MMU7_9PROT|nr:alpha/beta fold hydrolase [Iodidimonas gelatinilytica]GEQ96463.1 hydrolase 2, exosortase A system-associated [Iodidimonas gelatinilytica]